MKLKIKVDTEKLVRAFEGAPDETREKIRQAVKTTAKDIKTRASAEHRYTSRSGTLERSGVHYRVERRVKSGAVGYVFLDEEAVKYARYIHEGKRPHMVEPRNKNVLRRVNGEDFEFGKRFFVRGTKPDPFLYNAAEKEAPAFERRLAAALDEVLEGL